MSGRQVLIAIDQLANAIAGGYADETISARAHRCGWKRAERVINWMFCDDQHCAKAYLAEVRRVHLHASYRNG